MPPAQCPACGRFLKNSFVVGLADRPSPCPGCDEQLDSGRFAADGSPEPSSEPEPVPPSPTERAEDELHGGGVIEHEDGGRTDDAGSAGPSVRPPDLPPEDVRDAGDVLHGWDTGAGAVEVARDLDRAPFPTDTVVVAGAGAAGLVLGIALGRDRRLLIGVTGAVAGLAAGAVVRQLWRLDA